MLVFTSISLFRVVNYTFNRIWKIEKKGNFLSTIAIYGAIFTCVPILFGFGQYLTAIIKHYQALLIGKSFNFLPLFFTWLGFLLILKIIDPIFKSFSENLAKFKIIDIIYSIE